ncbi:alternative NAD(P)H-ubiquinone oxidoreductase C1, chloroplastic/mitochondrial isoform X1 [Amborella trichopoda]|uniref:demethylphylloquinone reductase n=1 Tax=Amborella trichopoda TaxID=13333 RepID=W1P063_AMBTC|nr:alternative NAD(P)H-ubiquinone oxidoreductase C1, chloroplastic/mitochondrial isoform X1 [Amborella trichopoda]ERN00956.1 hypothetical protein AMTR_s00002p00068420 [Amborella trichopoda]|eukprot:XP_006838387.1 alternative NAD(P)H-ubiquinone oxidoreductase C1, chloroplastic/mitochondrial isoform X1 [Amborella trichopoda]
MAITSLSSMVPFAITRRGGFCQRVFLRSTVRNGPHFSLMSRPSFGCFCTTASGAGKSPEGMGQTTEGEQSFKSFAWPDPKKPRICILGGGFGGLYTALRLDSLVWPLDKKPNVLLVDQSDRFVFKPLLYELLSGEVDAWEIAPRFSELLANTSVQFFQDKVKRVSPCDNLRKNGSFGLDSGGTVHLESGVLVEYDWLVVALGAEAKLDTIPGAFEFAIPFGSLDDACKVDNELKKLERRKFGKDSLPIRVAVVGSGYCGVELAATISERLLEKGLVQVINVENTICPNAPAGNREAASKVLTSRNVRFFLGYYVSCVRKASDMFTSLETSRKDASSEQLSEAYILELRPAQKRLQSKSLEADLVLWTVGSKPLVPPSDPCEYSNVFPLNARGQTETDENLRVKGHPRIFAIGDSAALRDSSGRLLPATAQVAFQQADFAGWNLWAAINNRPLLPFRFQNLGEMITLGKYDAAVSPSFLEGLTLEGLVGHTARKLAYLYRLPTDEHRIKVGISWFTKSAIDSIATLQGTLTKVLSN